MSCPFTTLGVSRSATKEEVRRAYLKLAVKHHPDKGGSVAGDRMKVINEAYERALNILEYGSGGGGGYKAYDNARPAHGTTKLSYGAAQSSKAGYGTHTTTNPGYSTHTATPSGYGASQHSKTGYGTHTAAPSGYSTHTATPSGYGTYTAAPSGYGTYTAGPSGYGTYNAAPSGYGTHTASPSYGTHQSSKGGYTTYYNVGGTFKVPFTTSSSKKAKDTMKFSEYDGPSSGHAGSSRYAESSSRHAGTSSRYGGSSSRHGTSKRDYSSLPEWVLRLQKAKKQDVRDAEEDVRNGGGSAARERLERLRAALDHHLDIVEEGLENGYDFRKGHF